jgi:hypothetical protein
MGRQRPCDARHHDVVVSDKRASIRFASHPSVVRCTRGGAWLVSSLHAGDRLLLPDIHGYRRGRIDSGQTKDDGVDRSGSVHSLVCGARCRFRVNQQVSTGERNKLRQAYEVSTTFLVHTSEMGLREIVGHVPGQKFFNPTEREVGNAAQHFAQPAFGIDAVEACRSEQGVDGSRALAATV